jgi:hypothetical protein
MFHEKEGTDYSKLLVTPEGEYSITKRREGNLILQLLTKVIGPLEDKIVTDLTGNIGGDTILFALNCKKVHSIEYNEENFNALKNNIEVFNLSNVSLYFNDSVKIYNWYSDILYIDPPWGGPDYKQKKLLDVYLGDTRIDYYIQDILHQVWVPNYIILKLPRNYNFERLNNLEVKKHNFPVRSFNIVIINSLDPILHQ